MTNATSTAIEPSPRRPRRISRLRAALAAGLIAFVVLAAACSSGTPKVSTGGNSPGTSSTTAPTSTTQKPGGSGGVGF